MCSEVLFFCMVGIVGIEPTTCRLRVGRSDARRFFLYLYDHAANANQRDKKIQESYMNTDKG